MATNISWKLSLEVQSGPNITVTNTVQADAYDRIEVKVPNSTAASSTPTTIDVQPGTTGKVKLLLIRSSKYGDNLKYKVHENAGTTPERVLNDAVFLVGAGGLELLEDANKPLDKLFVTNKTGQDVVLEILVGRSAT